MDRCGKMNKGWYVAGLILAVILLLIAAAGFVLGVCAFDTADYPMIGETGIYPAGDCEILPEGAAAVVRADGAARWWRCRICSTETMAKRRSCANAGRT